MNELGTCDICRKTLPISRGDNFHQYQDDKWACNECQKELEEMDLAAIESGFWGEPDMTPTAIERTKIEERRRH